MFGDLGLFIETIGFLQEPLGVPGIPNRVIQISAGYRHSAAITGEEIRQSSKILLLYFQSVGCIHLGFGVGTKWN